MQGQPSIIDCQESEFFFDDLQEVGKTGLSSFTSTLITASKCGPSRDARGAVRCMTDPRYSGNPSSSSRSSRVQVGRGGGSEGQEYWSGYYEHTGGGQGVDRAGEYTPSQPGINSSRIEFGGESTSTAATAATATTTANASISSLAPQHQVPLPQQTYQGNAHQPLTYHPPYSIYDTYYPYPTQGATSSSNSWQPNRWTHPIPSPYVPSPTFAYLHRPPQSYGSNPQSPQKQAIDPRRPNVQPLQGEYSDQQKGGSNYSEYYEYPRCTWAEFEVEWRRFIWLDETDLGERARRGFLPDYQPQRMASAPPTFDDCDVGRNKYQSKGEPSLTAFKNRYLVTACRI